MTTQQQAKYPTILKRLCNEYKIPYFVRGTDIPAILREMAKAEAKNR